MKLLTDVSYYDNFSTVQYDLLGTGTDGMIVRISYGMNLDSMARNHLENARTRQMPVCGYHWADPLRDPVAQARFIVDTAKKYLLPSIFLDVEQYWTDWSAYMSGNYPAAFATRFTPSQLEKFYHRLYDEVLAGLFGTGIEVGIYSADWFIDGYCPTLATWIFDKNYWEARYLRYYNPVGLTNVYRDYGKPISIDDVGKFETVAPIAKGIARQFESLLYVKSNSTLFYPNLDWNFMTDAGYNRMFQMDVHEEPTPPLPPPVATKTFIVNTWSLNIRSGPGTEYPKIGSYYKGNQVSILEVVENWGRTGRGWVSMEYLLPIQNSYKVVAPWLNIREYPSVTSKIVGGLKLSDIVFQLNASGNWVYIGKGWVSRTYLIPA